MNFYRLAVLLGASGTSSSSTLIFVLFFKWVVIHYYHSATGSNCGNLHSRTCFRLSPVPLKKGLYFGFSLHNFVMHISPNESIFSKNICYF